MKGFIMARPTKQEHEKRTARLPAARVTLAELAYVQEQAANAELSLTDYIRTLALHEEVKPARTPVEDSLLVELNRIGVNINQVAHAANVGRFDQAIFQYALDELVLLMKKINNEVS